MKKLLLNMFFIASFAQAGDVLIKDIKTIKQGDNYTINVTIQHDDTGWNHYANKWEVLDEKGNILASRVLAHPHINEQPFTRGISNVKIDKKITIITIKAYDLDGNFSKKEARL